MRAYRTQNISAYLATTQYSVTLSTGCLGYHIRNPNNFGVLRPISLKCGSRCAHSYMAFGMLEFQVVRSTSDRVTTNCARSTYSKSSVDEGKVAGKQIWRSAGRLASIAQSLTNRCEIQNRVTLIFCRKVLMDVLYPYRLSRYAPTTAGWCKTRDSSQHNSRSLHPTLRLWSEYGTSNSNHSALFCDKAPPFQISRRSVKYCAISASFNALRPTYIVSFCTYYCNNIHTYRNYCLYSIHTVYYNLQLQPQSN